MRWWIRFICCLIFVDVVVIAALFAVPATIDFPYCIEANSLQRLAAPGAKPDFAAYQCVEFWLNRYQTLLGAGATILAAVIAWFAVQWQVREARMLAFGSQREAASVIADYGNRVTLELDAFCNILDSAANNAPTPAGLQGAIDAFRMSPPRDLTKRLNTLAENCGPKLATSAWEISEAWERVSELCDEMYKRSFSMPNFTASNIRIFMSDVFTASAIVRNEVRSLTAMEAR